MTPSTVEFETKPLKRLAGLRVSNVDKKSNDGETTVRLCNYTDVYYADTITHEMDFMVATATAEEISKFRLRTGDVLITKDSEDYLDIGVPAYVAAEAADLICGYHLAMLRPDPTFVHPRFLFWAMASGFVSHQLSLAATGLTRYGLRQDSIASAAIPCPPLGPQRAIADFLDRETERIDRLAEKKRRLIQLFEEKRTALISHAATKGLDPTAPMKDSGIPWLGDIPAHWDLRKLKYAAVLKSGEGITSTDIYSEGEYPVYGGNGLRGYATTYTHTGEYALVGRQGALCGNVNYAAGKFFASEHAVVVDLKLEGPITWLGELLRAMNLNQHSKAAAQPGLAVEVIQNLEIPVPPAAERRAIAEHLDSTIASLQKADSKIAEQLDRLAEYRQALITAAVTGQIDVRAEALDPEEALA